MSTSHLLRYGAAVSAVVLIGFVFVSDTQGGWWLGRGDCCCTPMYGYVPYVSPQAATPDSAAPGTYTSRYGSYDDYVAPEPSTNYYMRIQPAEPRSLIGVDDPTTGTGL